MKEAAYVKKDLPERRQENETWQDELEHTDRDLDNLPDIIDGNIDPTQDKNGDPKQTPAEEMPADESASLEDGLADYLRDKYQCRIVTNEQVDALKKAKITFEKKSSGDKTVIRYKQSLDEEVGKVIKKIRRCKA